MRRRQRAAIRRYADIVTGLTSPNASRRVRVSGRSPGSRADVKSSRPHLPVPWAQWFLAVSGSLTVAWAAPDLHPPSGCSPVSRFSPGNLNFLDHLRRRRAYADESGCAREVTCSLLPKGFFACIERGQPTRGGGRSGADPAFGVRVSRPRRVSSSRGWALGPARGAANVICALAARGDGSISAADERVDRVTLGEPAGRACAIRVPVPCPAADAPGAGQCGAAAAAHLTPGQSASAQDPRGAAAGWARRPRRASGGLSISTRERGSRTPSCRVKFRPRLQVTLLGDCARGAWQIRPSMCLDERFRSAACGCL